MKSTGVLMAGFDLGLVTPHGTGVVVPTIYAEQAINAKWQALGGSPGASLHGTGADTLIEVAGGYRRSYANGSIYTRRNIVNNDWQFNPFFVGLATDQRYDQLGGPTNSFLGFPVSDFEPDPNEPGSGVTRFEHGAIYFWPDIGAIEMREISLRYVGFYCFGESNDGPFSASDEVYFTIGVVPTLVEHSGAPMTRLYENVDAHEARQDLVELYRGLPFGTALAVTLVEHDDGDRHRYHDLADNAVEKANEKVVEGLAQIPVVGFPLAGVAFVVLSIAQPAITAAVEEL
ncbi:MAG: hypothetical protein ABL962_15425, partial [Fimbriimonadaceae bacterium]